MTAPRDMAQRLSNWQALCKRITQCRACPRLVAWREQVAQQPRRMFQGQTYWAKPVPGFGDLDARLLICGLAPAAHGGNRTGRVFTGDRSGDFLFSCLYEAGLANQPVSVGPGDGLELRKCYITAVVRCAPPQNRPLPEERDRCLSYLVEELALLNKVEVILCLGAFAWQGILRALAQLGHAMRPFPQFGHGNTAQVGPYSLVASYHPSQQNTFTGKLTKEMFLDVLHRALRMVRT